MMELVSRCDIRPSAARSCGQPADHRGKAVVVNAAYTSAAGEAITRSTAIGSRSDQEISNDGLPCFDERLPEQ